MLDLFTESIIYKIMDYLDDFFPMLLVCRYFYDVFKIYRKTLCYDHDICHVDFIVKTRDYLFVKKMIEHPEINLKKMMRMFISEEYFDTRISSELLLIAYRKHGEFPKKLLNSLKSAEMAREIALITKFSYDDLAIIGLSLRKNKIVDQFISPHMYGVAKIFNYPFCKKIEITETGFKVDKLEETEELDKKYIRYRKYKARSLLMQKAIKIYELNRTNYHHYCFDDIIGENIVDARNYFPIVLISGNLKNIRHFAKHGNFDIIMDHNYTNSNLKRQDMLTILLEFVDISYKWCEIMIFIIYELPELFLKYAPNCNDIIKCFNMACGRGNKQIMEYFHKNVFITKEQYDTGILRAIKYANEETFLFLLPRATISKKIEIKKYSRLIENYLIINNIPLYGYISYALRKKDTMKLKRYKSMGYNHKIITLKIMHL